MKSLSHNRIAAEGVNKLGENLSKLQNLTTLKIDFR